MECGDRRLPGPFLTGHKSCVYCLAYSVKGDLLASGGDDCTVRIWDVASGECRAVMQDFQGAIRGVSWRIASDINYLVTGTENGSVLMWKITEGANQCRANAQWSATTGALVLTEASVQDTRGLSQLNKQLLKQRGAVGDPEHALRSASKKLIAMSTIVSRLKEASKETEPDISSNAESSLSPTKIGQTFESFRASVEADNKIELGYLDCHIQHTILRSPKGYFKCKCL
jgi:WD40 repeat protein